MIPNPDKDPAGFRKQTVLNWGQNYSRAAWIILVVVAVAGIVLDLLFGHGTHLHRQ